MSEKNKDKQSDSKEPTKKDKPTEVDIESKISQAASAVEAAQKLQAEATSAVEAIQKLQVEAATATETAKTSQTEVASAVEAVQKLQAEAATATETAKTSQTEAAAAVEAAKKSQTNAATAEQASSTNATEINSIFANIKANRDEVLTILNSTNADSKKTAQIAKIADEKDKRVDEYQKELASLHKDYQGIKKQIESLLPGATSTGLAKSFNMRRETLKPTLNWARRIFLISILGFIAIGVWAFLTQEITTFKEFTLFTFKKSPIILGLIFLEEFARRLYHNTLKLEEDYAYKETISLAFEGYKKAMSNIDLKDTSTLAKTLSDNVLSTLNERPGRLYDTDKKDKSHLHSLIKTMSGDPESKEKIVSTIYEDIKSSFKSSTVRVLLIISLSIAIGIGIGYYISQNNNIDKTPITINESAQPK